jgi:hypothetical protein
MTVVRIHKRPADTPALTRGDDVTGAGFRAAEAGVEIPVSDGKAVVEGDLHAFFNVAVGDDPDTATVNFRASVGFA